MVLGEFHLTLVECMAGTTGLEPAASAVTSTFDALRSPQEVLLHPSCPQMSLKDRKHPSQPPPLCIEVYSTLLKCGNTFQNLP